MDKNTATRKTIDLFAEARHVTGPTSEIVMLIEAVADAMIESYTLGEMAGFSELQKARAEAYDEGYSAGVAAERAERSQREIEDTQQ